jgi:pimeloyl-ACP methyl ester carboxylesterase
VEISPTRYARAADGVSIAYVEFGSGPPIVQLGAPFNLTPSATEMFDWQRHLLEPIADKHRIIYVQPRGTGLSQRAVPYTLDDRSLDIPSVMDALQIDRAPVWAGWQSTFAAVRFAARHPERVSHLILHGPALRGADFYKPGSFVAAAAPLLEYDVRLGAETIGRGGPGHDAGGR